MKKWQSAAGVFVNNSKEIYTAKQGVQRISYYYNDLNDFPGIGNKNISEWPKLIMYFNAAGFSLENGIGSWHDAFFLDPIPVEGRVSDSTRV